VDQAAGAGWVFDDPKQEVTRGRKEFDTGDATIGISIIHTDGAARLTIILTHEFTHPTN
jgi:hypothetical protein